MKNGLIKYSDGTKRWWKNGERHREDGPAIEYPNGTKEWCKNGKRHREDGPAVEWPGGVKSWWRNGIFIMRTEGSVTEAQVKEFKLKNIQ